MPSHEGTAVLGAALVTSLIAGIALGGTVTIDIPGAERTYGFGQGYGIAVPIEVDPARVIGLRLAWAGHGLTGQARCDGLGEWGRLGGYIEFHLGRTLGICNITGQYVEDGPFAGEAPFHCTSQDFLDDGLAELSLAFWQGPWDCEEYLDLLVPPSCTLTHLELTVETVVPVDLQTWGSVKGLYGR